MPTSSAEALQAVKDRIWFYEFDLPDGTRTRSDIPQEVLRIHTSRRDKLIRVINEKLGPSVSSMTALDFASHEGFFTIELANHFASVQGFEVRTESIAAARLITDVLGVNNVTYTEIDLQKMRFDPSLCVDFVLVFGLLYHLENPIHTLRLASQLSRKHILVETQVFPYELSGSIEDGHYRWQRSVHGVFSLSADYSKHREGGSTNLALVPSLNALLFLLRTFGFSELRVIKPDPDDYEQFSRGSRKMVYGAKTDIAR
jgi:hypothetical protein